jgi:hypothetical protein
MSGERKFAPVTISNNRQQLILLFALLLLIPFTWFILLGWLPGKLIPQKDYLELGLIYQREFSRVMGDWEQLLFWPGLGGGVKVHDITGSLPIAQMMAYLQVDLVTAANVQAMFIQTLFAYLCTCCAMRLPQVLSGNREGQTGSVIILAGLMFAFLPIVAWRIPHGHDNIIIGLFTLLCFLVLMLDEIAKKRSFLTVSICVLTLCHTLPYNSFQLIHYSVLFGAPIVLGILFAQADTPLGTRIQWTLLPMAVFLVALLISLPKLYGILTNGLGDESSRAVGSNVVYSYTTATWQDWMTSLTWSADFLPANRGVVFHHEVNYPLGPIVLLLLLAKPGLPLFRSVSGLLVSLLMALFLSLNVEPISTFMINTVPLLESFRVPARAILPFIVVTSILGVAVLFDLASCFDPGPEISRYNGKWRYLFGVLLVVIGTALNDSVINEVLLILSVVLLFFYRGRIPRNAPLFVIALFAGAAVAAFKERSEVPLADPITEATIAPIRDSIYKEAPELRFPLNRVHTNRGMQGTGLNSHFFWGISSLFSYWFPLERYSKLVMTLEGVPYRPTQSTFLNQPTADGFETLNRLFNVGWELTFENNEYRVERFGSPFGKAWLSSTISAYETWEDLSTALISNTDSQELILLSSDNKTQGIDSTTSSCQIKQAPIVAISDFPYRIDLSVAGECYLTVSMNFTNILLATDQNGRELRSFPAYGSLLGIVIDTDVRTVWIEPTPTLIPGSSGIQIMGLLLALVLFAFVLTNPSSGFRSPRNRR